MTSDGRQVETEDPGSIALRTARNAAELWRTLVLHDPHGPADTQEAQDALRRLHGDGQSGAATTALVLLTSWRYRRHTAPLLTVLLDAEVLRDPDLDELAQVGLFDDAVLFALPASTFSGSAIVLRERRDDTAREGPGVPDPLDLVHRAPVRMTRPMQPPLRRWAAGHLLRREPDRLTEVRARVRRLTPRDAAAAMAGVLDSRDALPSTQAADVLSNALGWPHPAVRLHALRLLAAGGDVEQAVARARDDPAASIRAVARTLSGSDTLF